MPTVFTNSTTTLINNNDIGIVDDEIIVPRKVNTYNQSSSTAIPMITTMTNVTINPHNNVDDNSTFILCSD